MVFTSARVESESRLPGSATIGASSTIRSNQRSP